MGDRARPERVMCAAVLERFDEWKPDVIVMDLLLPGGIDGLETTRRVCGRA